MTAAVPVAPSLEPVLEAVRGPREDEAPNRRTLRISALAIVAAFAAATVERAIDLTATLGWLRSTNR